MLNSPFNTGLGQSEDAWLDAWHGGTIIDSLRGQATVIDAMGDLLSDLCRLL